MHGRKKIQIAIAGAHPAVWRFALAMTGRRDIAEDLAQSTMLRALERIAQFKTGSVEAWCITICRSIWLNEVRARAVRDRAAISLTDDADIMQVFSQAETNLFAREVFTKVMSLPEAQRETVALVYVSGFTYAEAAKILGVPIGTVMSRLAAARSKLLTWSNAKDLRHEVR
ncbi:sigma-70 family RNA polymerase sigma factor [uncultured Roseobacter sp.]|uniref:RNA polymerase sigma factor n=1 Tax=uncultured Roseobacter sp. TaxID=114847 RepID=UPI002634AC50|nr:sigma-70 family RNA polymerase sigma factor [uncultured Roseobacter sp.]